MQETGSLPQAPELVEERVIDDRYRKYGKQILERDFRMRDGAVVPILCVSSSDSKNASIIFAFTDESTILLTNQFRFGINGWLLELAGGGQRSGQSWEEIAKEELLQELGVEASKLAIIGGQMFLDPYLQDGYFTTVLATGCRVVKHQSLENTEFITVTEFPIRDFREMLRNGKITDSKTVAASYLALDHLGLLGDSSG